MGIKGGDHLRVKTPWLCEECSLVKIVYCDLKGLPLSREKEGLYGTRDYIYGLKEKIVSMMVLHSIGV